MPALQPLDTDIWLAEGPVVDFHGFPYPTRMVLVRLPDGALWAWSPVALTDELRAEVEAIGTPAHLVSPNAIHHLYLSEWHKAWPGAKLWGPAKTIKKRGDLPFQPALEDTAPDDWQGVVTQAWFRGSPLLDEIAFVHRPSSTAIFADLSENFSDGVVAPIFFYLIFGLPGLFAYKAINTLDSMIAYKTTKYRSFGFTAAKLDDLANWLPARISGALVCLAACFTPTSYPISAVKTMLRDAKKHKSPNGGWPEGAFAGALNIALGGPRTYPGGEVVGVWIGDGRARLEPRDIDRSRALYIVANLLLWFAILCGGIIALL